MTAPSPSPDPTLPAPAPPAAPGEHDLICPGCGYNLFGAPGDRCPECGLTIDRSLAGESRLPWTHRKSIGRVRAFRQTVWLATFHPSRIAMECNRPVSYADARKFQWACVWVAWVPIVVALVPPGAIDPNWMPPGLEPAWWERAGAVALLATGVLLFLLTGTGVASYFFHPRGLPVVRQNRAVALSYYAAGSLAWTPIAVAGGWVLAYANERQWQLVLIASLVCVSIVALGQPLAQLVTSIQLLRRTTHCTAARAWAMAFLLPVFWLILAVLFVVVMPAAVLFVAFVVASLR